jgi:hypothetical protein
MMQARICEAGQRIRESVRLTRDVAHHVYVIRRRRDADQNLSARQHATRNRAKALSDNEFVEALRIRD